MVRILFFMALCLAAAPALSQGRLVSPQTGLAGGYSSEVQVSGHRHFAVYAQANVIERAGNRVFTVLLRHGVNDGSIIYIDQAWSYGRALNFEAMPPDRVCGGLRCVHTMGVLTFSGVEFAQLAQTGIDLRLIGSEGPIDLAIPPHLFAEAATEAAASLN